ncbi:DUF432 domain-containing protein [Planctomycetota bacterium]
MNIWTKQTIKADRIYNAQVGPMSLWLKKIGDEIQIAVDRSSEKDMNNSHGFMEKTDPEPESLDWGRWVIGKDENSIQLAPMMPNRGVVVQTEPPVKIPPGKEAVFFVSVPIWIKICTSGSQPSDLCEVPTIIRSNTWFGDSLSGELCYSLVSRARRQVVDADHPLHRAVCPVKILNGSHHMLHVDRFCVHVEYLSIYGGTRLLWTNDVTICFQGEDQISRVDYARQKPDLESQVELLTAPRIPLKETLLKRSLGSFARLTDF